jgi:hypothetical protein
MARGKINGSFPALYADFTAPARPVIPHPPGKTFGVLPVINPSLAGGVF